jgi:hypothetical protein
MTFDVTTILIVVSLGLFTGTGTGLIIGYLANLQKPDWHEMSRNEILANIALIVFCSAIVIAGLAWYAFRQT